MSLAPAPSPSPPVMASSPGPSPVASSASTAITPAEQASAAAAMRARAASTAAEEAAEHAVPRFSAALEATLQEVCPSDDPLDAAEFDPIAFINTQFPDEASLVGGKLDSFLAAQNRKVAHLQASITRDVRQHSGSRSQTLDAISSASNNISDLFSKVALIKDKASASEVMVHEICRDIRALDTAKKHLTLTIRALRNLHMLVSAVGQLDFMVAEKQYRLAAERLRAIQDLFTLFEAYGDVPKIRSLQASVESTRALMKEQLTGEFHRVLPSPLVAQEPQASLMADACAVVDVLDMAPPAPAAAAAAAGSNGAAASPAAVAASSSSHFKADLLHWFCNLQLDEYSALFAPGKDGATVEQIERRYAWLKNWLRTFEQRYSKVFPAHWAVAAMVCREFCKMSKMHINKLLAQAQARGGFDVQVMINALLATLDFEKALNAKYRIRAPAAAAAAAAAEAEEGGVDEHANEAIVDQIKRKYAKKTDSERAAEEAAKKAEALAAERALASGSAAPGSAAPSFEFSGSISECFTPYMGGYVEMERKNLSELIDKFEREENWANPDEKKNAAAAGAASASFSASTPAGAAADRFHSSNDLFQYIKSSMNRCLKLNKNATLFALYQEYKRGLTEYCKCIEQKLPKKQEGQALTHNEIVLSCYIINTCEYIQETLPGLSDRISTLIESPYKEQINLDSTGEEFGATIAAAVQVLVASMWTKLNKVLAGMTRLPWATWSSVGDESAYVGQCALIFREELPLVALKLSPRYHPFFCSSIASSFIPRFVDSIYKCKRIGELGAQQMSLDAHALKNVLLSVPSITSADAASSKARAPGVSATAAPSHKSFHKYVNTEMSKAEALIKTLASPNERLIVTFKALLPKSSVEDLMRIMNLRGLKRTDQEALVAGYNATAGPDDQLKLKTEKSAQFTSIFSQLRNN